MSRYLFLIISTILAMLPIFFLLWRINKKNLPPKEVSKQFPMPIVGAIYVVIAMILLQKIEQLVEYITKQLPSWIHSLANWDKLGDSTSMKLFDMEKAVRNFVGNLANSFTLFIIINFLILFIYLIVRKIALAIIKRVVKRDGAGVHGLISEKFYEYSTSDSFWFLKDEYGQTKSFIHAAYWGVLIIGTLMVIVCRMLSVAGKLNYTFFPVFVFIIVGEIYFYFRGMLKSEYKDEVAGEDDDVFKITNYATLRDFLRTVFPDKILAENTKVNKGIMPYTTNKDEFVELENSDDTKEVAFGKFFERMNSQGKKLDITYLNAALNLLNHKSIVFNNPFYKDFSPYVFYPANRTLLQDKKVLIILGRHGIEEDIKDWAVDGFTQINHLPSMWKVDVLDENEKDIDVGIITRSDLHNLDMHATNSEFFKNVGMCFIIEPSKIISTSQIGLSSIIKKCIEKENKITYCCLDRNCDGLVDSLSHILMTNIDIVNATDNVRGTTSYMCWDTDNELVQHRLLDNIVRYLGVGTELSFAGLKNQVSKVHWYGGEAFPVTDMKWIDRQYYYDLCNYADLPAKQDVFDEVFDTTSNYWSAGIENQSYITVEDESYNMFEVMRNFSTRTTDQGFINIITSNYLFKDYMANNFKMFESDPKAIPYIVSDYARTGRNVALRLLLLLSTGPVMEKTIESELSLIGIKKYKHITIKEQLWNEIYCCFASASDVDPSLDYEKSVRENADKTIQLENVEQLLSIDLIKINSKYNPDTEKHENVYSFENTEVINYLVKEMRNASYITEDEMHGTHFLGAELFGHIFQKVLPGQLFTFEGKYYEMNSISGSGDVMVRRASDHINGRVAYRQIRNYKLSNIYQRKNMGSVKSINGFTITQKDADIEVNTDAYYRMKSYDDFASAKRVEVSDIPKRTYKNKHLLEIELPGEVSQKVKYTITVLLNESFRTFFAENQEYIVALTDKEDGQGDYPLTHSISLDSEEKSSNTIYIVEDSQMDIGLLIAVERNIRRILETIFDFLEWHKEAEENSKNPPPEKEEELPTIEELTPTEEELAEAKEEKKNKKNMKTKKSIFGRLIDKIKSIFKRKKKDKDIETEEPVEKTPEGETPEETPEGETPEENTEGETTEETSEEETPEEEKSEEESTEEETPDEEASEEETSEEDVEESTEEDSEEESPEEEASDEDSEKIEEKEPMQLFSIVYTPNKNKEEPSDEDVEETSEEETPEEEAPEEETSEEETQEEETPEEEAPEEETSEEESEESPNEETPEEETSEEESSEEDTEEEPEKYVRKPYHEHNFLFFGFEEYMDSIDIDGTIEYLGGLDLENNILEQARHGESVGDLSLSDYKRDEDKRYCDFCGREIYGVEYETLVDGRERCMRCGKTAIKEQEEFVKLFEEVKRNMQAFFKIKFNVPIKVEMVNAQKLHKRLKQRFTPTPELTPRVLGVAISDKSGFSLLIENGSPRISATLTLAHELTHIWQYTNWDTDAIDRKYGDLRLEVYEGMAKWVEVQYAYLMNEPEVAWRTEAETLMRKDEYGRGLLRYLLQYSVSKSTHITKTTPFNNVDTPLDIE